MNSATSIASILLAAILTNNMVLSKFLGMGVGFTAVLTLMGAIRELLGAGSLFSLPLTSRFISPMIIFLLPPGGFFVFGMLVAASNALAKKNGKKPVEHLGCESCPSKGVCGKNGEREAEVNE